MVVIALLVMAVLSVTTQPAFAGLSWCGDLGPMAMKAEERIPEGKADHAKNLIVTVAAQAVSVEKGGANPHK